VRQAHRDRLGTPAPRFRIVEQPARGADDAELALDGRRVNRGGGRRDVCGAGDSISPAACGPASAQIPIDRRGGPRFSATEFLRRLAYESPQSQVVDLGIVETSFLCDV
jgi:hypothetical protein